MKTIQTPMLSLFIILTVVLSPAQAQNLFVTAAKDSTTAGLLYEYTTNGTPSTFASGLDNPAGLDFDSAGNLFLACVGGGTIYKYTTNGTRSTFASGVNSPNGLAFDSAGNLFVASLGGSILKFAPNGTNSTFASGLNWTPFALAFDSTGNLFVTDYGSGTVYKFTPDGTQSTFASGIDYTRDLAFDAAGNLFVSSSFEGNGYIYKFTTNGVRSTFASGLDPMGLAFDSAGNLFAADFGGGKINKYTPSGAQSTFATGISEPWFLAVQPIPYTPTLNIAPRAGNQTVLFWPASATNYVLQSATNQSSPNWVAVTNGTPITGVSLTNTLRALFLRLYPIVLAQGLTFTTNTYNVGSVPSWVVAADVNGDGKLDLICANSGGGNGNTLTVLTNNGSGGFGSNATLNVGSDPYCVVAADVNGDGKPDLISANDGDNTLTVLTNNGSGGFGSNATLNVGSQPDCVVAADVNGDGKLDLISANVDANTLTVLTNNGSGGFGSNATLTVGSYPVFVVAADINGDGKLDLISSELWRQHADSADEQRQRWLWLQCHAQRGQLSDLRRGGGCQRGRQTGFDQREC